MPTRPAATVVLMALRRLTPLVMGLLLYPVRHRLRGSRAAIVSERRTVGASVQGPCQGRVECSFDSPRGILAHWRQRLPSTSSPRRRIEWRFNSTILSASPGREPRPHDAAVEPLTNRATPIPAGQIVC